MQNRDISATNDTVSGQMVKYQDLNGKEIFDDSPAFRVLVIE